MRLVQAIVRPEKAREVIAALEEAGHYPFSKWDITGRGKERGIKVGDIYYNEIFKTMLYIVVADDDKDEVVDIIMNTAMTGEDGNAGDGKIFVSAYDESYTISSQSKDSE